MGKPERALPVLVEQFRDGSQWARLDAAIELDSMDQEACPAIDAMKEALQPRSGLFAKGKYTVRVITRALAELPGDGPGVRR